MSASLVVLGSSAAVQTAERDNTAFVFSMDGVAVLVDCPGSAIQKLWRAGIDPLRLGAVVITHAHADHLYGLPSLAQSIWLLGRSAPLPVFAPQADLERLGTLLALFNLHEDARFLEPRGLTADGVAPFWEHAGHRLSAFPVDHGAPTYAIRWDLPGGARVVYSSDTRPVDALAEFGRGAAIFIHEATHSDADSATAREHGHTTARQAGRLAALANAGRLLMVHVGRDVDVSRWVAEARTAFSGPIDIPTDGAMYPVG